MNEFLFDFGTALKLLKAGDNPLLPASLQVARKGWDGEGMYVFYRKGFPGIGSDARFQPYLMLKTANQTFVPWVPSQTDLLAEDWFILAPLAPVEQWQ